MCSSNKRSAYIVGAIGTNGGDSDIRFRRERQREQWVCPAMAIDKESNGVPEVDLSRRTTKVNLWMIVAVAFFFVVTGLAVYYFAR